MKLNKNIYDRRSSSHAYHRSSHSFFAATSGWATEGTAGVTWMLRETR